MSQPLNLTKTQKEALKLLAEGAEMIDESISDRKFGFDTVSFLKRRKFVQHKDPNHEPFYEPEILVITKRGQDALSGKLNVTFKPSPKQKEYLNRMSGGENMLWELRDNVYGFWLGEMTITPTTISVLQKQKLIEVLIKGKRSDSAGNGHTITEKGRQLVN